MNVFWVYGEKICEKGAKTNQRTINSWQEIYAFVKMFELFPSMLQTAGSVRDRELHILLSLVHHPEPNLSCEHPVMSM